MWRDGTEGYGLVAIGLHWLVALTVIGLFALGLWMVSLEYYHPWYNHAPDIHRSVGLLLLGVVVLRLGWRLAMRKPAPEPGHSAWERRLGHVAHWLLNGLTLLVIVAGYLISTADGRAVSVFGWFEVPALFAGLARQEQVAGWAHEYLAYALIGLAALHALAALKHHFIDRDSTLVRMLRPGPRASDRFPR